MAKNEAIKGKTLDEIRKELTDAVDKYNLSSDPDERTELEYTMKQLVDAWNELSMLTAYASFLTDEQPLVAFGKAYTYATIGTKDHKHNTVINGVKRSVSTRSVEDGVRLMSITKFLGWAQESNKTLAADKLWIGKFSAAREEVNKQWKRVFDTKADSSALQIGKMKRTLQDLFDALVFIEAAGGSGKNAIVATNNMAKYALGLANVRKVDLAAKTQTVQNMDSKMWEQVAMDIWHMVCSNKTYTVVIGDEEPEAEEKTEAATTEEKTEA